MTKIRIKNCDPIISCFDSGDDFIEFGKYTLFIGDQGTGKSTVAKLISIFSWIEKALFRGDYDANAFDVIDFRYLYQNQLLNDSFNDDKEKLEFEKQSSSFMDNIDENDGRYVLIKKLIEADEKNGGGRLQICDVGCGKGRYLKRLFTDLPNNDYYASDISEQVMAKVDVVKSKYAVQMAVYQTAVREMCGQNARTFIYYTQTDEFGEVVFDASEVCGIIAETCSRIIGEEADSRKMG